MNIEEAASAVGVTSSVVLTLIRKKKFAPSYILDSNGSKSYGFTEGDIARLEALVGAKKVRLADAGQDFFTVSEIAGLWNLSADSIRRLFEDEPGVITLGDKNPRGKRRRVTLRIPREVVERVKRKRAQK